MSGRSRGSFQFGVRVYTCVVCPFWGIKYVHVKFVILSSTRSLSLSLFLSFSLSFTHSLCLSLNIVLIVLSPYEKYNSLFFFSLFLIIYPFLGHFFPYINLSFYRYIFLSIYLSFSLSVFYQPIYQFKLSIFSPHSLRPPTRDINHSLSQTFCRIAFFKDASSDEKLINFLRENLRFQKHFWKAE